MSVLVSSPQCLQWGRNLFVAESSNMKKMGMTSQTTFNGAATCSLRKAACMRSAYGAVCTLQWGRNLFVAERAAPPHPRPGLNPTFNGAATCSLRKEVTDYIADNDLEYLQWGRNLFVAESDTNTGASPVRVHPSMGPQLVRCGKSGHSPRMSVPTFLQWGRNLFVAEIQMP